MAKGKEIEDGTGRRRKGDKMEEEKGHSQSNKGKNKKNSTRNGKDIDDGKDEPEVLVVQDSETEDGDEEDEVAHNDSDEDESGGDEEEEAEEEAAAAENGGEEVEGGGSKKKKRKRNENGKSKKKESDDSHCFPMNRISRIIKSEDPDIRITQEAVFLVNKATEKFLELFCKEAYACASLESKNQVWYKHLSSVVSKRKRFDFLLDIVPEKVKAEDALAEMPVAET